MPLAPQVTDAARAMLFELGPIWLASIPADLHRVVKMTSEQSSTSTFEPYKGAATWRDFFRRAETSVSFRAFKAAVREFQPELAATFVLDHNSYDLSDGQGWLLKWCKRLAEIGNGQCDLSETIDALIREVSSTLTERKLTRRITTYLVGLRLPSSIKDIKLTSQATLCALPPEEQHSLLAEESMIGTSWRGSAHLVWTYIAHESSASFSFSDTGQTGVLFSQEYDHDSATTVSRALRAAHIAGAGSASVLRADWEYYPDLLPNTGQFFSSVPFANPPFQTLELDESSVSEFVQLYRSLEVCRRKEVLIASDRLFDAESRHSSVDSLVDSTIGLEVLLNPVDHSELAFRTALNYAFLSSETDRRRRFDAIRSIQKVRNHVVHGGLNLQSQDGQMIHESASLAKACLRDALKRFLLDETLGSNRKLDAEFWLDRILPNQ